MNAPAPHPSGRLAEEDRRSLAEPAYRRLRDAIFRGALPSGRRLSERSPATAPGISTRPVREVLRRLEPEGMAVTLSRRGTMAARSGSERQAEMGRIRAAPEGTAAARAAAPALRGAMREASAAG